MNIFKKTVCAASAALALASYPAKAASPKPMVVETAAMGDCNVSVSNDFEILTNPALMELRGSRFSFAGLNLRLNDPREAMDTVKRYAEFFDKLESVPKEQKADYMDSFVKSEDKQSLMFGLSLLPSLQLSTRIGTFGLAGFGVSDNILTLNPKSIEGLVELQREADRLQGGGLPESKEFVVEKPVDAISVTDAGVAFGYAKMFDVAGIFKLSGGFNVRGFERALMDYAPSAKFVIDQGAVVQDVLDGSLDGKLGPEFSQDISSEPQVFRGRGYAADLGLLLQKDMGISDVMMGVALKNAYANKIYYYDMESGESAGSERDKMQYAVGLSSHPMKLPVLRGLLVAAEMHGVGSSRSYHAGASWKLGSRFAITPKVGMQSGLIDPRGDYSDAMALTAGAMLDLVVARLGASYSYDTKGSKHQVGAALSFGYEWDK